LLVSTYRAARGERLEGQRGRSVSQSSRERRGGGAGRRCLMAAGHKSARRRDETAANRVTASSRRRAFFLEGRNESQERGPIGCWLGTTARTHTHTQGRAANARRRIGGAPRRKIHTHTHAIENGPHWKLPTDALQQQRLRAVLTRSLGSGIYERLGGPACCGGDAMVRTTRLARGLD
jgi:hypothetical protein